VSVAPDIIERMFDKRIHDHWDPPETPASRALLAGLVESSRQENRAAARRLAAVAELFEMRRAERGESEEWAVDTWAAVGAEVAAALRVSLGKAGSYLNYGLAMRRLPSVAAVFAAGEVDLTMFTTIVYRTELITDSSIMVEVDSLIAARAARWPSMTPGRLAREIDRVVHAVDPDAVRRARERSRDRDVTIWHEGGDTADVSGRLLAADAAALDRRLDAVAATACEQDPRSAGQRRADALGALAAGADRLMCRCGSAQCPAAAATPSPIVIHVVAEQSTLAGRNDRPALLLGTGTLITAEQVRDLAAQARVRPLIAPPVVEPRYRPSRTLADFVRARDLTCRAPGCDRPAVACDLDHTVPYAEGGATHASNMKCLCRLHHLIKTFWGWQDKQLVDGTVIWTLPGGQTYVTTPGSALLFPSLSAPTRDISLPSRRPPSRDGHRVADRAVMMPVRKTTRAANRAHRIATERTHNRRARQSRAVAAGIAGTPPCAGGDPPF